MVYGSHNSGMVSVITTTEKGFSVAVTASLLQSFVIVAIIVDVHTSVESRNESSFASLGFCAFWNHQVQFRWEDGGLSPF